jgi:hypothetical protein
MNGAASGGEARQAPEHGATCSSTPVPQFAACRLPPAAPFAVGYFP